jgi:hypothetical protein
MVTVQTATPEQITNCVLVLKGHIDRVEAQNEMRRKALIAILGLIDYLGREGVPEQIRQIATDALEGGNDG